MIVEDLNLEITPINPFVNDILNRLREMVTSVIFQVLNLTTALFWTSALSGQF
jgi:hypothetical protein